MARGEETDQVALFCPLSCPLCFFYSLNITLFSSDPRDFDAEEELKDYPLHILHSVSCSFPYIPSLREDLPFTAHDGPFLRFRAHSNRNMA